jgi:DNA-binding CsgD family transcriptional regulator
VKPKKISRLLNAAASLGAISDVAREVLPELTQITHSALVFLYDASPYGVAVHGPAGASELVDQYFRDYVADCPLHQLKLQTDGSVIPTTRLAARAGYEKSAVYNEFFRPHGFDHHLSVRLLPANQVTGEIGLMLNRGAGQGDFSRSDAREVQALMPSLTAALRRATELDHARRRIAALETVLLHVGGNTAKLVYDDEGRLIHAHVASPTPDVAAAIGVLSEPGHPIARAAGALARGCPESEPRLSYELALPGGHDFRAELSRTDGLDSRHSLTIVTLVPSERMPTAWACWHLSRAEASILKELVAGGSNVEIGARLFISPETVRTHLTRIFRKMGVRSRLDAVVTAMRRAGASETSLQ